MNGKIALKKKNETKTKTIAIRLTTEDRDELDELVKDRSTTITEYVTSAIKERLRKDKSGLKKIPLQSQSTSDGKFYFKKYLDDISGFKRNR